MPLTGDDLVIQHVREPGSDDAQRRDRRDSRLYLYDLELLGR